MQRRGLILIPEFAVDVPRNELQFKGGGSGAIESQVREHLPYWDMFDLPDNPVLAYGLTPDLEFLRTEGIIRKTNARPRFSGAVAELWVRSQFEAWRLNEAREPGQWSLAQQGATFWLPPEEQVTSRTIETTLYAALPIPGLDVSDADILEFKARRAAELEALRADLDALYLSIVASSDLPRATGAAVARVERALVAIHKVSDESWASRLRSTIKVDLSVSSVAVGAIGGAAVASSIALPLALGAGVGAVAAALKFELKQESIAAKLPQGVASLAYACEVERELQ